MPTCFLDSAKKLLIDEDIAVRIECHGGAKLESGEPVLKIGRLSGWFETGRGFGGSPPMPAGNDYGKTAAAGWSAGAAVTIRPATPLRLRHRGSRYGLMNGRPRTDGASDVGRPFRGLPPFSPPLGMETAFGNGRARFARQSMRALRVKVKDAGGFTSPLSPALLSRAKAPCPRLVLLPVPSLSLGIRHESRPLSRSRRAAGYSPSYSSNSAGAPPPPLQAVQFLLRLRGQRRIRRLVITCSTVLSPVRCHPA